MASNGVFWMFPARQTISDALLVARMRNSTEFMQGTRAGLEDWKAGKIRRWSDIKRELGLAGDGD